MAVLEALESSSEICLSLSLTAVNSHDGRVGETRTGGCVVGHHAHHEIQCRRQLT